MGDPRDGAKKALDKFFGKQAAQLDKEMNGRPSKKRERPEFELTVKPVKKWCELMLWSVDVIEARAVYSHDAGRYLDGQAVEGFPDISGCDQAGHSVYIECKAPGNWRGLKPHQREFLLTKIRNRAFAVCVESADQLAKFYAGWQALRGEAAIVYLLNALPPVPVPRKGAIAPDPDLGF